MSNHRTFILAAIAVGLAVGIGTLPAWQTQSNWTAQVKPKPICPKTNPNCNGTTGGGGGSGGGGQTYTCRGSGGGYNGSATMTKTSTSVQFTNGVISGPSEFSLTGLSQTFPLPIPASVTVGGHAVTVLNVEWTPNPKATVKYGAIIGNVNCTPQNNGGGGQTNGGGGGQNAGGGGSNGADLAITAIASTSSNSNTTSNITGTLKNNGPAAVSVSVKVTLTKALLQLVPASLVPRDCVINSPTQATCALGNLPNGQTITRTVLVTPPVSLRTATSCPAGKTAFEVTASVSSTVADPTPSNNSHTEKFCY